MFCRSASLAIPHLKSFAAIPSVSPVQRGHMNRVKFLSFRHFQDRFLTANKEKCGKDTALCFARFVFLTFRGSLASHDSNPFRNAQMSNRLSIKLHSHPPRKSVNFEDSLLICTVFLILGPWGGEQILRTRI